MWIRTWDWTDYKFMVSIMITHWHITRLICRLWYMTLPKSTWLMRLALTNSLLLFVFLPILVSSFTLVTSFSLGIPRFAWVLNMIQLFLLEAYTMISQKGASWSWISLVQLSPTDATLVDGGYFISHFIFMQHHISFCYHFGFVFDFLCTVSV